MIEQENFTIIEPPVFVGFEVLKVEADGATGHLRRISHFRWRDRDYWLLAQQIGGRLCVAYAHRRQPTCADAGHCSPALFATRVCDPQTKCASVSERRHLRVYGL